MSVHSRVQKLLNLKLIEEETDTSKFSKRELERGAKYYKMSEEGIFALFINSSIFFKPSICYVKQAFEDEKTVKDMPTIFTQYKKEIFKNHRDSNFFKLFLFPWISLETIEKVNEKIINCIISCLNECCNEIKFYILISFPKPNVLDEIGENEHLSVKVNGQDSILNYKTTTDKENQNMFPFVEELAYGGSPIVKIKTEDDRNNILLTRSYNPNTMLLANVDKDNKSNINSFFNDAKELSYPSQPPKKDKPIPNRLNDIMVEDIDLKFIYFKSMFSMIIEMSKDDDLRILSNDKRFMENLSELKERFNSGYEMLSI